jgi:hypothetical protein
MNLMTPEAAATRRARQAAFTLPHKMQALAYRFYDGVSDWQPQVGDFYTLTRTGTELFQITRIDEGNVWISNCQNYPDGESGSFALAGFTTDGFGPRRVHVPGFILALNLAP